MARGEKMNNNFAYVFKTTDETVEKIKKINLKTVFTPNDLIINNISKHTSSDIRYPFNDNLILKGTVLLNNIGLNNVKFEIRTESKFIFLYTGHQVDKDESIKIIEKMFGVEKFIPNIKKERKLLFEEAVERNLRFIKDGDLLLNHDEFDDDTGDCIYEYDDTIQDKYRDGELDDSYKLYEADLDLSDVNNVDFCYYKQAINISTTEYAGYILDVYERVMA